MAEIKDVSGTAFVVAEFRAEENREAAPLYRDPIVDLFLSEDSRRAAERLAARFPPVREMVRVRTKYFDDTLEQHLLANYRQVVILGAGLDTRAVRKQAPGVAYFEIDDPATLQLKRACYEQEGINADVTFVPGDYVADGLIELLARSGFDFDLPTYVIWEGNTMYLPLRGVEHVLSELRTYVAGLRVSFDYMAEAVITKTTGDAGITTLVESFASMGAPWLSGVRDLRRLAADRSLRVIEDYTTAALHRTYWRGRRVASPIFDFYSVCTLGV